MKKLLLLFTLLIISIIASAANISSGAYIYFDATAYSDIQSSISSGRKLQVLIGHDDWSEGFLMSKVSGYENIYVTASMPKWDNATKIAFMTVDGKWESKGEGVTARTQYGYTKTGVASLNTNISGKVGFACNPLSRTDNYTPKKTEYYVAGNGTSGNPWCGGEDWNTTNSKMDSNGSITFSKVPAGTYEFKVVYDCAWLGYERYSASESNITCSDNGGNIKFTTTDCSDITIKYASNKITVNVTYHQSSYVLKGVGGDWDNGIPMTKISDNEYQLVSQPISKTKDAVKVVKKSVCGDSYCGVIANNSLCEASSFDKNGNIILEDGTYNFTYYKDSHEIYIESSNYRYVLMGVKGDWNHGIELTKTSETTYELIGVTISRNSDKVKIVKDTPCKDDFYELVDLATTCPYNVDEDDDEKIVLEDGVYNFYFDTETEKIRIEGKLKKSIKIYLEPNANWKSQSARFALYYYNSTEDKHGWVNPIPCDDDKNIYYAEFPIGYDRFIWCRMNPAYQTNRWNNEEQDNRVWNELKDNGSGVELDPSNLLTQVVEWNDYVLKVYTGPCSEEYEVYVEVNGEAVDNLDVSYTLSGIVKDDAGLNNISECGFLLNRAREKEGVFVSENIYISDVEATASKLPLKTNDIFDTTVSNGLVPGYWYGYRAYVKVEGKYSLSPTTNWFYVSPAVCDKYEYKTDGDTAFVTIDLKAKAEPCKFVFNSFEQAWATLKTVEDICTLTPTTVGSVTVDQISLKVPVVMLVVAYPEGYSDSEECGASGGDTNDARVIFFRDINTAGGKPLVVRSKEKTGPKATLNHVVIRRSKNITFDYLNITGTSTDLATADNAIDIDNGEGANNLEGLQQDWNGAGKGSMVADANVLIKNSNITSSGFTCIHVAAYDGVTFENNQIKAEYDFEHANPSQADNTALWGASAKFINSSNIRFIRNDFIGQHATSILLQGSKQVLIHNNVFWHDNSVKTSVNTVAIIRLSSYQSGDATTYTAADFPLQNIGIYYNTMFLKDNNVGTGLYHNFDFFRLGGNRNDQTTANYVGNFNPATIKFTFNNCYSYDTDVYGKNNTSGASYYLSTMTEADWCSSFEQNNFWSVWDLNEKNTESAFEIGADCADETNYFINVKTQVCNTSPNEPGSLIIKGGDLNKGNYIEKDASGLLTKEMQVIDRLGNTRPDEEGKTLGAYQQSNSANVDLIIWNGEASDEWDNRNNWYKKDGTLVNCMDLLSENLEVIIPAPNSENYPTPEGGVKTYPIIPDIITDEDFNARENDWNGEQVNAGSTGKIADRINVEYGGSIQGVEKLNAGEKERYSEAKVGFTARRNDWLLVGPVVKPWKLDEEGNKIKENGVYLTRDVISNDYYLYHFPHVYMRRAEVELNDENEIEVTWNTSFADLDSVVTHEKAFAIRVPDQYGPSKIPAEKYNERNGTAYNGNAPQTFDKFVGRFYNESSLPAYSGLKTNTPVLLNNTYPANLNASKIVAKGGTVQIYDYSKKAFRYAEENELILSQHGFVFNSNGIETLSVAPEDISNTETGHRDATLDVLSFRIEIENAEYSVASEVYIRIDEAKEDVINYAVDAPKLFNGMQTSLPDLYVMRYDKTWAGVSIPTISEPIPLGIRVKAENQVFTFSLKSSNLEYDIILEDRETGETYNLSKGAKYSVNDLVVGRSEGRFYVLLQEKEVALPDDSGGGEDVSTEVEEVETANAIDIFTQGSIVVVSASEDVELQKVIVSDISGRVQEYNVSGRYIKLDLPVSTGIYTINVVNNKQTRVEKIKLN